MHFVTFISSIPRTLRRRSYWELEPGSSRLFRIEFSTRLAWTFSNNRLFESRTETKGRETIARNSESFGVHELYRKSVVRRHEEQRLVGLMVVGEVGTLGVPRVNRLTWVERSVVYWWRIRKPFEQKERGSRKTRSSPRVTLSPSKRREKERIAQA